MSSGKICGLTVKDVRFPTSREQHGSDAMHTDPDYSAAYVIIETDSGTRGFGLTFTVGKGTEIVVCAVQALSPLVLGKTLDEITADFRSFYRLLTSDGQMRWVGPEKGVIHLATAAVLNAIWDLWARAEGKPVWKLLVDMTGTSEDDHHKLSDIHGEAVVGADVADINIPGVMTGTSEEDHENISDIHGDPMFEDNQTGTSEDDHHKLSDTHGEAVVGADVADINIPGVMTGTSEEDHENISDIHGDPMFEDNQTGTSEDDHHKLSDTHGEAVVGADVADINIPGVMTGTSEEDHENISDIHGDPMFEDNQTPEQLVSCIDFRYISDALTEQEALDILRKGQEGKQQREERMLKEGYPAYTTSCAWLGYPDQQLTQLCSQALADGWTAFKVKVGAELDDDIRRCRLIRQMIGPDKILMIDANQRWDVGEAVAWVTRLSEFRPLWIEEPTSPDDILGHAHISKALAPLGIGVASGEQCHNRVMFKQFLQAGALQFVQIDSCRVGSINENLAILLMASKFNVPVCPHAGGVGLCELVQHLILFDYICVSGSLEKRMCEYVDHLHEHFKNPTIIRNAHYMPPVAPGFSSEMVESSVEKHTFPQGEVWRTTNQL